MNEPTRVTLRFDAISVSVECPHDAVDTETIRDAAMTAMGIGRRVRIIPRWKGTNQWDGPSFDVFVETLSDGEIEDDDRRERPEEFDLGLEWWQAWESDDE